MDIHLRKFSSSSVSEQETKNNGNRAVNYNKDLFFMLSKYLIIYSAFWLSLTQSLSFKHTLASEGLSFCWAWY